MSDRRKDGQSGVLSRISRDRKNITILSTTRFEKQDNIKVSTTRITTTFRQKHQQQFQQHQKQLSKLENQNLRKTSEKCGLSFRYITCMPNICFFETLPIKAAIAVRKKK